MSKQSKPTDVLRALSSAVTTHLDTGTVAELRRMSTWEPDTLSFFRIVASYIEPHTELPEREERLQSEIRKWALILQGMALAGHSEKEHSGAVFYEAGVSEHRLQRILRTEGRVLHTTVRGALHQLRSAGRTVNWNDLGILVLTSGTSGGQKVRLGIARDYYRAQHMWLAKGA